MMNSKINSYQARKQRAMDFAKNGRFDKALVLLEKLHINHKSDVEIICMLGITYKQLNRLSKAEKYFQALIDLKKDSPMGFYYLADLKYSQKKYNDALNLYKKALKLVSEKNHKADCMFNIAKLHQLMGHDDQSIKNYQESITIQPDNPIAYYNIAILKHKNNDIQQAIKFYNKAISYNGNYFLALNNLASILLGEGQYRQSEMHYRKALSLHKSSVDVMMNLANALNKQGKHAEAIALYSNVVDINPKNIAAWQNLGAMHRSIDDNKEAIRCYKIALELDPENENIQFKLAATEGSNREKFKRQPASGVRNIFDGYAETFDKHLVGELKYQVPEIIFSRLKKYLKNNHLEV